MKELIPQERIERKIYLIRGQKVMLDRNLAGLYGIKAIRLREQVKRNIKRFPVDFMFQLNESEIAFMVSHFAIPSWKHLGGYKPYVFTEQGVAMLSSVLKSERAIQVNIAIMRAFVRLKQVFATHKELARKLKKLEEEVGRHNKLIIEIFEIIKQLTQPPEPPPKPKGPIGFTKH